MTETEQAGAALQALGTYIRTIIREEMANVKMIEREEWIDEDEACKRYGRKPITLWNWRKAKNSPIKYANGKYLDSSIREYLKMKAEGKL